MPLMTPLKESPDVRACQILERPFREQGNDVASDPPAIDCKGAGLLGQALAPDNEPSIGLRQVLNAKVAHGHCLAFLDPPFYRVEASFNIAEKAPSFPAGLIRGQSTVLTDGEASRHALAIAKLDHKRLKAARLYPQTKAPQFLIPQDPVSAIRLCCVDRALCQLHALLWGVSRR